MKNMTVKKKIIISVIVALLILILIFVMHSIKNIFIINELQNKFLINTNSDNLYVNTIKRHTSQSYTSETIEEYYQKGDNVFSLTIETNNRSEPIKTILYETAYKTERFIETNKEKIAILDLQDIMPKGKPSYSFPNQFEERDKLIWSTVGNFSDTILNGKECYLVSNLIRPLISDETVIEEFYVEKETGLLLKIVYRNGTEEFEYEFGSVDDSVFVEPDIKEYEIITAEQYYFWK